jgi:hypothetical protein
MPPKKKIFRYPFTYFVSILEVMCNPILANKRVSLTGPEMDCAIALVQEVDLLAWRLNFVTEKYSIVRLLWELDLVEERLGA